MVILICVLRYNGVAQADSISKPSSLKQLLDCLLCRFPSEPAWSFVASYGAVH